MQRKHLATALNISTSMVCRLAKRGMPTDDLERAQRWRKRHLEPGRVKGVRFEPPARESLPKPAARPDPFAGDDLELDMCDAFECLAVAARLNGEGGYLPALAHLFPIMSDAQQQRALASSEISLDLWALIHQELHRIFPLTPDETNP